MTLNTFHSAGLAISTVLTGVPRFSELLNATKEPKSILCNVYMKDSGQTINEIRETIGNKIRCIYLQNIMDGYEIDVDNNCEWWYDDYCILYDNYDHLNYNICIKITLDKEKMFNNFIDTTFVVDKLRDFVPHVIYFDNNVHLFYEQDSEYNDYYLLNDIILPDLIDTHICGIKNIHDFFYQKDDNNNWYITCDGSNMNELFKLDFINIFNTCSNNMWEIYKLFGIEAVRQFLIDEFMYVVSSDGTYINERHVKLLVDVMTQHGMITSISRYGMKKDNSGPIAKASFEQSLDNFIKASFYCEKEKLNGVSSNIMCGKKTQIGTNMCDLLQDLSVLNNSNSRVIIPIYTNPLPRTPRHRRSAMSPLS